VDDPVTWLLATLDKVYEEAEGDANFSSITAVQKYARQMMREVEAKRRIVNSFAEGMEAAPLRRGTESYAIVRMVLRQLALPYADWPGYREEWERP
jgi:hypothetical protein